MKGCWFYMMMIPRRSDFDLLDDIFRDPFFTTNESRLMKTDIKEKNNEYSIDMDLPGYEKENIKMSIEEGYLIVQASTTNEMDEKEEAKFVRRERYSGTCSRSFYIGEEIEVEDIKANFKNGILRVTIPKKEIKKTLPDKKYIKIED